jgi:hypothetical protein
MPVLGGVVWCFTTRFSHVKPFLTSKFSHDVCVSLLFLRKEGRKAFAVLWA